MTELDREKPINEMAKDLASSLVWGYLYDDVPTVDTKATSKNLQNKGYCKASDIANEFFEALKNTLEYIPWSVIELIRKYTMEENK